MKRFQALDLRGAKFEELKRRVGQVASKVKASKKLSMSKCGRS